MATTSSAISGQTPGQTQFMGRWSNTDPSVPGTGSGYRSLGLIGANSDHLYWSYATGTVDGCSGTFVGPNVLLGAGHCGHRGFSGAPDASFRPLVYAEASEHANGLALQVRCETLVQNNEEGDFHFYWCDDISLPGNGGLTQPGAGSGSVIPPGFRVRSFPAGNSGHGVVVLGNGSPNQGPQVPSPALGQIYIDEHFSIPGSWEDRCTDFHEVLGSDNLLKFGHINGNPEYLIDRVRLVKG